MQKLFFRQILCGLASRNRNIGQNIKHCSVLSTIQHRGQPCALSVCVLIKFKPVLVIYHLGGVKENGQFSSKLVRRKVSPTYYAISRQLKRLSIYTLNHTIYLNMVIGVIQQPTMRLSVLFRIQVLQHGNFVLLKKVIKMIERKLNALLWTGKEKAAGVSFLGHVRRRGRTLFYSSRFNLDCLDQIVLS